MSGKESSSALGGMRNQEGTRCEVWLARGGQMTKVIVRHMVGGVGARSWQTAVPEGVVPIRLPSFQTSAVSSESL